MLLIRLFLCLVPVVIASCSSVEKREAVRAEHSNRMNIPEIDDLIINHKKQYIDLCYMPVMKRIASNSPRPCETKLFQTLERRYSMNYTQEQVDMAADELFFEDMHRELLTRINKDTKLKRTVRKKFKDMNDLMAYYKPRYSFRKQVSD